MLVIYQDYEGNLPFTGIIREVSGPLYATSTFYFNECLTRLAHIFAFDPELGHAVLRGHREPDAVPRLRDVDVGRDLAALEPDGERGRVGRAAARRHVGRCLLRAVRRQLQLAEYKEVPPEGNMVEISGNCPIV